MALSNSNGHMANNNSGVGINLDHNMESIEIIDLSADNFKGDSGRKRGAPYDYFGASDNTLGPITMPGGPIQEQANDMNDNPEETTTNSGIASTGSKRRKTTTGNAPNDDSSSLFVSPTRKPSAFSEAPPSVRRAIKTPRGSGRAQAPPTFGSHARNIASNNPYAPMPPMQMTQKPQSGMGMLPPHRLPNQRPMPTGNIEFDIAASLRYMEQEVTHATQNIVQPVIELTRRVQKLEAENAKLHADFNALQLSAKKSVSEVSERQDEHEELIDRLGEGNAIINPAGTAYGGPRNTAIKKPSPFQGMLAGNQEGTGGAGGPNT